jgi:cytochrome c oxidase cbb3-type subunit 3
MLTRLLLLAAAALIASAQTKDEPVVRIYNTYCVQCHGLNRNGTGLNRRDLAVQPRDHTDAKSMGDAPDEELARAIREGGLAVNKSVIMPAWGGVLKPEEITALVQYLRTVCKCGKK